MGWLIGLLAPTVGEKFARPVAYAALAFVLLAMLGIGKCTYDRAVIAKHEAKQDAANAKADRKADAKAADQRRVDDARLTTEQQAIKEAIDEAKRIGADPRRVYYDCVREQQRARAERKSPAFCGSAVPQRT